MSFCEQPNIPDTPEDKLRLAIIEAKGGDVLLSNEDAEWILETLKKRRYEINRYELDNLAKSVAEAGIKVNPILPDLVRTKPLTEEQIKAFKAKSTPTLDFVEHLILKHLNDHCPEMVENIGKDLDTDNK